MSAVDQLSPGFCSCVQKGANQSASEEEHFIGAFEVAPPFMKDNHMITDGYRINFKTTSSIIKSLFMLHNQSVNIWTHCLSALFLIFLLGSFCMVIEANEFTDTFKQYRREVQTSLHSYHQRLKNVTLFQNLQGYDQQPNEELNALKHSILVGYQQMTDKIVSKSMQVKDLLNYKIEGIKSSILEELKIKLAEFQHSKLQFQRQVAPRIVQAVQHTFNLSLINTLKFQVEKMKNHLDSNIFQIVQLHAATPNPHDISRWPIFLFLFSAFLCLLFSTLFHLFHPMSSKTYGLLLRFDFAGISLLITGSTFPAFYYAMYCQMAVATIYLTFSVTAGVACFLVCLFEWIHKIGNEKYRSLLFGTFGLSMLVPLSHLVINDVFYNNYGDPFSFTSSITYYILLTISYVLGLYIYTVRCPERNNPGKYNICGHSHQIFHVLVVLGIVFTYLGALESLEMRKHSQCPL